MTSEIATSKTFQDRMFERIRESMGELMTAEEMRALVDKAMHDAFFKERTSGESYSRRTDPPLFVEMVRKEMQEQVTVAVKAWVVEHPEEVARVIKETLEKGVFDMARAHFERAAVWPLQELSRALQTKGVLG